MDIQQINITLNQIFTEKNKQVIFWYDADKEFEEILPALELDGAQVLRLDEMSALELKIKLELEEPNGKYVLYAPWAEPAPENDWLFDIKLYSYLFQADPASMALKELGIDRHGLIPYIRSRIAFFKNKDRLNRLKKWVNSEDHEDDIDLKLLTVVTRADQPEPFSILMKLIDSFCKSGKYDDSEPSKQWTEMEKLDLMPVFWKMLKKTFGYEKEDAPGMTDFLLRVFVTDFANTTQADLPASLSHFMIPNPSQSMNASVFLSQWRSHTGHFHNYKQVSRFIAQKLKIEDHLKDYAVESIIDVMTFEAVEREIIRSIRDGIINISDNGFNENRELIKRRLDGYWTTTAFTDEDAVNLYKTVYQALLTAIDLFEIRQAYDAGFSYPSADAMFTAYTKEIFLFDQRYRNFNELADKAELAGWDVLKTLRDKIEDVYSGWFMTQLSLKWGDFLESDHPENLLNRWRFSRVMNQYDFFNRHVQPLLKASPRNRLFVIVSDAFRYEAAEELTRIINGKYRLSAEIKPMLGVLPSYTALGMAALLPHQKLTFKQDTSGNVLIDEQSAASTDQRAAILSRYNGTAIKSEDLMAMSKDKGREFVKPHRVIFIYHDHIDAIGDKQASESNTFDAVRKTIEDLYSVVSFIINSLNGTHVLITADHGFIYQEKPPEPIDKSHIQAEISHAVKTHKRFVMGQDLKQKAENLGHVFLGNTRVTAKTGDGMDVVFPKGINRFNFQGGARFFHGGPMLQEVVVPVVSVSEMKGKHLDRSEVRHVGVSLLGTHKKILTNRPMFKFIQTDPVSERMKPLTLKISLRDGNELISNEETVTFDSTSTSLDERQKSVKLHLKTGSYDNKKEYALVMRNVDDTEYERIPIIIDIAIANDF